MSRKETRRALQRSKLTPDNAAAVRILREFASELESVTRALRRLAKQLVEVQS